MTSRVMRNSAAPAFRIEMPQRTLQPCNAICCPPDRVCQKNRSTFEATEILPGLYLGTYCDATSSEELETHNVTHVLNLASECPVVECHHPQTGRSITTKHFKLVDHSDEDIGRHFDDALEFIHSARARGEGVLVHCRMGVSRSATIVLAYLMRYGRDQEINRLCQMHLATSPMPLTSTPGSEGAAHPGRFDAGSWDPSTKRMSYKEAFDLVKQLRPQVSPNLGFVLALHDFDTTSITKPFSCGDSDASIPLSSSSPESMQHE